MDGTTPAIVVVGYNRPEALRRLLKSLALSDFNSQDITLHISIDRSGNEEVYETAQNFNWPYGPKVVDISEVRLGLKNHILKCGNLTTIYGSVIILEDDLYVSRNFYAYTQQTLKAFGEDERISGISLYSHKWNVIKNRPFVPEYNSCDVFLMQFAQSWGQCWNYSMWQAFTSWYNSSPSDEYRRTNIHTKIKNWSESSWLKHFMAYTVATNKYFVYPYHSLTTNFNDAGTHTKTLNTGNQVPLASGTRKYLIPSFENCVKYDSFFERVGLSEHLGLDEKMLAVDLYASKDISESVQYLLSPKPMPYLVKAHYGLKLRPHELNVIHEVQGDDILLYDLSVPAPQPRSTSFETFGLIYDLKSITIKELISVTAFKIIKKIKFLDKLLN
ncbi:hypothetical protein [Dyadobacter sp. Leaf189]|uniref:hypothetical protein n=1 Tax=Dyadobacter sp. Leaf189 TaxID=1736295 RepID=UPI0006FE4B65|nr:hypothetical protein [Dyadobacter sp. Leaf189]KQS30695.1 hypothetical protein ASG33_09900 [Dyadobacter sp. Leaf189]